MLPVLLVSVDNTVLSFALPAIARDLGPTAAQQLWIIDGPTEQYVASLVYGSGLFFMTCGYPTHHVLGIKPDGTGNVTNSHVAWHERRHRFWQR